MKTFLFIIACFLFIGIARFEITEITAKRTVGPEVRSLEIEILESCHEFKARDFDSIWISKYETCLPIQTYVENNPDRNNLHAHYFCTNINKDRSIVHFVEIFETNDDNLQEPFVFSFVPNAPFRVRTAGVSFQRRPSCWVERDYCNATNAVVTNCKSAEVEFKKRENEDWDRDGKDKRGRISEVGNYKGRRENRWVVNRDRVYVTSFEAVSHDCKRDGSCCAYIAPPDNFGGICPRAAPKEENKFERERENYRPKEDKKPNGY